MVGRSEAASRVNRNLLLFGLLTACIAGGFALWQGHQQKLEQTAALKLVLEKLHGDASAPTLDGTHPCVVAPVVDGVAVPSISRCATPTTHDGMMDQFEVDLRYGTFVQRQTDLQINDVFDIPLTRSYNSDDWVAGNRLQAFGRNSSHPYEMALLGSKNRYPHMMLVFEDGDLLYFNLASKTTDPHYAVFQHTETSTRFYKATINWDGNKWVLRLTDGSVIFFPEAYKSSSLAQCAMIEIQDALGNKLALQRDRHGNLIEILTPHGHWIRFEYDDQSRITKAEDDTGKWVRYEYSAGSSGVLLYTVNSLGRVRQYQYWGNLMTAIWDGHGHVLLRNTYQSGVVVRQVYGNGDVYQYRYIWNAKRKYYADKVIVTMPNGSTREVLPADTVPAYLR